MTSQYSHVHKAPLRFLQVDLRVDTEGEGFPEEGRMAAAGLMATKENR